MSELYFGLHRVSPLKVVRAEDIQKIDREIKAKLMGEKDIKRFNGQEVDNTFSRLTHLDGHGIGFYLKQLMQFKRCEIPKERLMLR